MSTILVLILAFLLMVVTPTILVFALKNHQKALKVTTIIFSCIYFVCLFIGTTCTLDIDLKTTKIGFDFTKEWCSIDFLLIDFRPGNMFVNLFMFFPLGFITYVFETEKPFKKTIIFALCLSLFIELYQFILPIYRNTELTDILFNATSGLISAYVCKFLKSHGAFTKENIAKKESVQ